MTDSIITANIDTINIRLINEYIADGTIKHEAAILKAEYEANEADYQLLAVNLDAACAFDEWLVDNPRAYTATQNKRETINKLLPLIIEMGIHHKRGKPHIGYIPLKRTPDPVFGRVKYQSIFSPITMPKELLSAVVACNDHTVWYSMRLFALTYLFGAARAFLLDQNGLHYTSADTSNQIAKTFPTVLSYINDAQYVFDMIIKDCFYDILVTDAFNLRRARYSNELDDRRYYKRGQAETVIKSVIMAIVLGFNLTDWERYDASGMPQKTNTVCLLSDDKELSERISNHPLINEFHDEWQSVIEVHLQWIPSQHEVFQELKSLSPYKEALYSRGELRVSHALMFLYQNMEVEIVNYIRQYCIPRVDATELATLHGGFIVDRPLSEYIPVAISDIRKMYRNPYLEIVMEPVALYGDINERNPAIEIEIAEYQEFRRQEDELAVIYAQKRDEYDLSTLAQVAGTSRAMTEDELRISRIIGLGDHDEFDSYYDQAMGDGMNRSDAWAYANFRTGMVDDV